MKTMTRHRATLCLLLVLYCLCVSVTARRRQAREKPPKNRYRSANEQGYCELNINCKGDLDGADETEMHVPVKLPIRGPRGTSGEPGMKGEKGEDGLPGVPGLPGVSAPVTRKVAFFVGLYENMGPIADGKDVIFDRIVTNVGGAYEVSTGRFTSPINGTYQFNVVVSAQGRQKAAVMVVKNGEMVATVWAESIPYWATASNVAILSLEKGDQVWLFLLSKASYLHGYMYTTFSGFLLFEN